MTSRYAQSKRAVFLGPSLSKEEAQRLLPAAFYPPAQQGDVYRILSSGVKTIVLLDGVFHSVRSVWQRELLDAIEEGIIVIGASSMGALRAAELHRYGMIGCGKIFSWYRKGVIDGDDEVALVHGTAEMDYQPFSEPLVNIRCTLAKAVKEHQLKTEQAQELIDYAKGLYYPYRNYDSLLTAPMLKMWPLHRVDKLKNYIYKNQVNIKKNDAIAALRLCKRIEQRRRRPVRRSFNNDGWWDRTRLLQTGFYTDTGAVTGEQILREAVKDNVFVSEIRKELTKRRFLLEWAHQKGIIPPTSYERSRKRQWNASRKNISISSWLRANGLSRKTFRLLFQEQILIDWCEKKKHALQYNFLDEWAANCGIQSKHRNSNFEEWILKKGPVYFGLMWNFEVEMIRHLQIRGRAGDIARKLTGNHDHRTVTEEI